MVKKEAAKKVLNKLAETSKTAAPVNTGVSIIIDRRKALPQPDFTHYRNADAYPGTSFFFVGHSYNVEHRCCSKQFDLKRRNAIKHVLADAKKFETVTVKEALQNEEFVAVLSRFERDWLTRLPETSLIGPAINEEGKPIKLSFTVWRKEQRKAVAKAKQGEKVTAGAAR